LPIELGERSVEPRHYLMCAPTYFQVSYAINPWMDPSVPVDGARAMAQWSALVETYRGLGHRVYLLDPVPELPDMVFAANGATVVAGQVLEAKFANPQRQREAFYHRDWHRQHRSSYNGKRVRSARAVNEAEGDFAVLSSAILAGHGFRTTLAAHRELARLTRRPVISLELVEQRFYHLDVALTVLEVERDHIAYYPPAFTEGSRRVLAELFPDALIADRADADVLGLNCVSDGLHVCVPAGADHLMELLEAAGYRPIPIELSELLKGGGSVKCCTQEIRPGIFGRGSR
jgi:N-dimethylarginine dimethylaminohydrolase